jgi:hypothetical protein
MANRNLQTSDSLFASLINRKDNTPGLTKYCESSGEVAGEGERERERRERK